MSFKTPTIGDAVNYRGRKLDGVTGISLTPQITLSVTSGVAPLVVQASAHTSTASPSSIDAWGDVEYSWHSGQSVRAENTFTHPWRQHLVSLDRDIVAPIAAFIYWEPGTYTITLTARVWNGTNFVSNTATAMVTVTARSMSHNANRFIDPSVGSDTDRDGLDSWGFDDPNGSITFEYNISNNKLTASASAFGDYEHGDAVLHKRNYVAIKQALPTIAGGLVEIASKTNNTELVLVPNAALPSTGGPYTVDLSSGPFASWSKVTESGWWGDFGNKTLWLRRGTQVAADDTDGPVPLGNKTSSNPTRILSYGDPAALRFTMTMPSDANDFNKCALEAAVAANNGRDLFVSGLKVDCRYTTPLSSGDPGRGLFTIFNTNSGHSERYYCHDCEVISGPLSAWSVSHSPNSNHMLKYGGCIGCKFDATAVFGGNPVGGQSVYVDGCPYYLEIACQHGGGGQSILHNHNCYLKNVSYALAMWNSSFEEAHLKNFFYKFRANGYPPNSEPVDNPNPYVAIIGCRITGTSNGVSMGDGSDDGTGDLPITYGWEDVLIADCWFEVGFIDGAQGAAIFLPASFSTTILDCVDASRTAFLDLVDAASPIVSGTSVVMERIVCYGTDSPNTAKRFLYGLKGKGRVRDCIMDLQGTNSECVHGNWTNHITTSTPGDLWTFDRNRVFIPNVSMSKIFVDTSVSGSPNKIWGQWQSAGQDAGGDTNDPGYIAPDSGVYFRLFATSAASPVGQEVILGLASTTEDLGDFDLNEVVTIQRKLWNIGTNSAGAEAYTPASTLVDFLPITPGQPTPLDPGFFIALSFKPKTLTVGDIQGSLVVDLDTTTPSSFTTSWSWGVS